MYFAGHGASLKLLTERQLVFYLSFLFPKSKNDLHFRIFQLMFAWYLTEIEVLRVELGEYSV